MTDSINDFTSEYGRKEVDFLKTIGVRAMPTEAEFDFEEPWIVLIATRNLERGIAVCSQLREKLGMKVKVMRIEKPSSFCDLKTFFDPEVILSDSDTILAGPNETAMEMRGIKSAMAIFLNKKNSTFMRWIEENGHHQSLFSAWKGINP